MPLWNAREVRGCIAVMLRGPKQAGADKIPPVSLLDKINHVKQART
jgi:hypothetical protein